ncbi:hypothetical protein AB0K48_20025 [Nonomuraea sp. NPDC055795]
MFTTYIAGFDSGSGHTLLKGFREWLIVQVNGGNNLVWEALVLMLAFPGETGLCSSVWVDEERNAVAVGVLFDALERFLADRDERPGGPNMIQASYDQWLSQQSWMQP